MNSILRYFWIEFQGQLISVGPISIILTLFVSLSRQRIIHDFWPTMLGMLCAAVGLTLFLFGLKGSIMPLAEHLGRKVNEKFSLPIVLAISFVLGVLVTLAEPAVSSLRPLGKQVDRFQAPYLFYLMNDGVELLLVVIGIGVGIAAVIGTARFVYRWTLKPLVLGSVFICLLLTAIIHFYVEDLRPTITLAWDSGAVTTGPVTVPILLALGKGAVSNSSIKVSEKVLQRPPMQGFGLVTLASVYPIICVQILSIIVMLTVSKESILESEQSLNESTAANTPPLREIITAIRSIAPLSIVLILLIKIVLRENLPVVTMKDIVVETNTQAPAFENEQEVIEADNSPGEPSTEDTTNYIRDQYLEPTHMASPEANKKPRSDNQSGSDSLPPYDVEHNNGSEANNIPALEETFTTRNEDEGRESDKKNGTNLFFWAILSAQVGLMMFNIGLHYGFTSLGEQVGNLMPAFYSEVEGDPQSPLLSKGAGSFIAYFFIFSLGILATRAEPGLKVLAEQVKVMTKGLMKRNETIYSVAIGVGLGMVAGTSRLQFSLALFPYLIILYGIAMAVTVISPDLIVKIAWDSAGVTTGPVTVPFVLSIGLAYAQARALPGGFGILSCASVGPIISVLLVPLVQKYLPKTKTPEGDGASISSDNSD